MPKIKVRKSLRFLNIMIFIVIYSGCGSAPPEWGQKLNYLGSELFYTSQVSEDEAIRLGDYLYNLGFFQEKNPGTAQLKKENNTYQLRIVVKKTVLTDMDYIKNAGIFAAYISGDVFTDSKVEIHLCDKKFNSLRIITYQISDPE